MDDDVDRLWLLALLMTSCRLQRLSWSRVVEKGADANRWFVKKPFFEKAVRIWEFTPRGLWLIRFIHFQVLRSLPQCERMFLTPARAMQANRLVFQNNRENRDRCGFSKWILGKQWLKSMLFTWNFSLRSIAMFIIVCSGGANKQFRRKGNISLAIGVMDNSGYRRPFKTPQNHTRHTSHLWRRWFWVEIETLTHLVVERMNKQMRRTHDVASDWIVQLSFARVSCSQPLAAHGVDHKPLNWRSDWLGFEMFRGRLLLITFAFASAIPALCSLQCQCVKKREKQFCCRRWWYKYRQRQAASNYCAVDYHGSLNRKEI